MQHRAQEQRRIGDAPRHDHRRAGGERIANHVGAEVSIGGRHARQQRFDRLAVLHERELGIPAHDVGDVVAGHHGHRQVCDAQRLRFAPHRARSAQRIGRAHVGDDAHAVLAARGQHGLEALDEVRRVAALGVLQAREVLARDGALGETLEHEIVELAALGQIDGRLEAVVGEAGAGADADAVQAPDDLERRVRRRHDPKPVVHLEAGVAAFRDGRHIRQHG